ITARRTTSVQWSPSASPAGIAAPRPPTGAAAKRRTVLIERRLIRRPVVVLTVGRTKQARRQPEKHVALGSPGPPCQVMNARRQRSNRPSPRFFPLADPPVRPGGRSGRGP